MITELVKLITAHSPRRFAGYVVFFLALSLCQICGAVTFEYTFESRGGYFQGTSATDKKVYLEQNAYVTSPTVYNTNHTLRCDGWYISETSKVAENGGSFWNAYGGGIHFYAKWLPDRYPIFYVSPNNLAKTNEQWVVAATPTKLNLNTFTRDKYYFKGWSLDPEATEADWTDGQDNVVLDLHRDYTDLRHIDPDYGNCVYPVTLYAVWGKEFTLKFAKNGGSGSMVNQVLRDGVTTHINKCSFTPPSGMKFDAWSSVTLGEYGDEDEITYDSSDTTLWKGTTATLTAQWTPVTYTIRFLANSPAPVKGSMSDMSVDYGDSVNLTVCAFRREGYSFLGWAKSESGEVEYEDGEEVQNLSSTDGAVVKLYAKWAPVHYLVRFDAAGGSGEMADMDCEYDKGYSLTPNAFSRVGGSFLGWTTNSTRTVFFEDRATISNLSSVANSTNIMKAVWSNIVYHIAFDGNGGSGSVPKMDCEYGTVYQLPSNAFAKTGYLFTGWTTNSTSAAVYTEGASVSNLTLTADATLTMFAAWRPITYRVTFDPNGGEGEMVPMTNTYDIAYTLISNSFIKLGRSFAGWATNENGTVVYNDGASVSNLVTVDDGEYPLFAVWQKAVNDLNAALDNNQLTILKDPGELPYLTVVSEPTATNGTCVKINRDAKNDGTLGFRVYLDSPGELKFNWKVVNVYPGWHNDGWTVKVHFEEPEQTNDVLYVHRDSDYEDPEMEDWEEFCVSVTNCPASLQFIFTGLSGNGSTDLYALFDFVRWSSGGHPEPTPEDAPVISGAATVEGGRFRITFPADARFKYELIKTESLAPVDWKSFAPQMFISPDTSGNVSFEPEMKAAEPQMFYRVKVLKKD